MCSAKKSLTQQFSAANVPIHQQISIIELETGGIENIGCIERYFYNAWMRYGIQTGLSSIWGYSMVFAPFVGVNHHGQTILFACAFLSDETIESFLWLLKQLLSCMPIGTPKMIITDQYPTMGKVIAEFHNCIWNSSNSDEFEAGWAEVVKQSGLSTNEWLKTMYELRFM
ncbi:protein FAR1-RELATED SEQUENCE 3-like [Tripterygium wilfordii]|uniref:protein FAR1-RELATED SEQUENCE 3-like n=1 Tax=Tripterygium wilfordii TaxID=458696 RepID=UPI0018F81B48|nr:protein FAR1-RELATED SEQUENCE 3-like [Tripterygium wilfordii]